MEEARGLAPITIDNALRAISEFERFTSFKDFGRFRSSDAIAFKKGLLANGGRRAAELSSRSTVRGKLLPLQRFFTWLAEQDGFRTKIRLSDVQYFNLSNRDVQIVRDRPPKPAPTLEQMQHVIRAMPAGTDLEKRDRAILCCTLLTGSRVKALTTLKLKHVRADRRGVDFDATEVSTKFGKTFTVFWFPVGDDIREMFLAYVDFLRWELLWGEQNPLFPKTRQLVGDACHFHSVGLAREHWATADPVRDAFAKAFAADSQPYFSPHTVRSTLAKLGQQICRTPEELEAWSQNLAHDDVLTTFRNYGAIAAPRQAEILTSLHASTDNEQEAFEAFKALRRDPRFEKALGSR
jgi:integrase/recombinase XerD